MTQNILTTTEKYSSGVEIKKNHTRLFETKEDFESQTITVSVFLTY